jgi:ribose 5-phosphate isomerase RpiB
MLDAKGYEVTNYGDTEESVDYPDFAHPVAQM